jgi:hypothetical protein
MHQGKKKEIFFVNFKDLGSWWNHLTLRKVAASGSPWVTGWVYVREVRLTGHKGAACRPMRHHTRGSTLLGQSRDASTPRTDQTRVTEILKEKVYEVTSSGGRYDPILFPFHIRTQMRHKFKDEDILY